MSKRPQSSSDSRQSPRLQVPPMYTLVRVRPRGDGKYCWTGYIYDISSTGMRFELDSAIEAGAEIEIRAMLPGFPHTTFNATGHVVRRHDDLEERGPIRMGMVFDRFANTNDRRKLEDYLVNQSGRMAA